MRIEFTIITESKKAIQVIKEIKDNYEVYDYRTIDDVKEQEIELPEICENYYG